MKIDKKNKKILAIVGAVVVGVGLGISLLYSQINTAENEYIGIDSVIYNLQYNIKERKQVLLELQDKMLKLNDDKEKTIQIDSLIADLELINLRDESKRKEQIAHIDSVNEEIDNILHMYNTNENMKKDIGISNNIAELEVLNNYIDTEMEEYNKNIVKFNKTIKKFPVTLIAEKNGWNNITEFSSIN